MLRYLRKYPKSAFQQRREDTGLKISNTTIKTLVRENSLCYWRAKKRPELESTMVEIEIQLRKAVLSLVSALH
jgi:hypothetical protein